LARKIILQEGGLTGSIPPGFRALGFDLSGNISILNNQNISNVSGGGTSSGTSGTNGTSGSSGTFGTSGTSGTSGPSGATGSSGTSGTSGTSGPTGATGSDGGYLKITQLLDNVVATTRTGQTIVTEWTTTYTSQSGSTCLFDITFTSYSNASALRTYDIIIDSVIVKSISVYFNEANSHKVISSVTPEQLSSGSHTIQIRIPVGAVVDGADYATMVVTETMSNGVNGTSGSSGTNGTSGTSLNISASYMRGSRSTQQTSNLTAGSLIQFTQVDNSTGSDISLNVSTGQITLAANKTYRLMAQIPTFTSSNNSSRPAFCWYNETTSSYIGSESATYQGTDNAGYGASGGLSDAVITTTQITVVSFRILSVSAAISGLGGNTDFSTIGSYPWFDIEVISGYTPLVVGTRVNSTNLALNTALSLDNVSVQIKTQSSGVWLFVSTVTGTASWSYALTYQIGAGVDTVTRGMVGTWTAITTPTTLGSNSYSFGYAGALLTVVITDMTAGKMYRVTWMTTTGTSPYGNYVTIEGLN
jgi:hypothetical protein